MYQRSADTFLGVPFNIASTALLTTILATALKTRPHKIRISFGDTHIYQEHIDVVKQQISRVPYQLPHVSITDAPPSSNEPSSIIDWIESLSYESFDLQNYKCHSILRAEMKA
jgi:thymidylate synthase